MPEQTKILIVDDDPNIREVLSILLGSEGYYVLDAEDGNRAIEIVKMDPAIDLIILDIMMPGISGIEACTVIRSLTKAPVLFLTAKSQDQDKLSAYNEGGDDYLVKPFSQPELLMKIHSLLRRYKEYQGKGKVESPMPTLGEHIVIDQRARAAKKEGRLIPLTDKEFAILSFFLRNRGEIVGNKDIYEGVWGGSYQPSDGNTVMVHILNLRKKLEDDINHPQLIRTIWGKGYQVD